MGYDLCDHGSLRRACEICQRDYEIEGLRARLDQINASNERAAKERDMYIEARGRWEKEKALWIEVVEKADAWLAVSDRESENACMGEGLSSTEAQALDEYRHSRSMLSS